MIHKERLKRIAQRIGIPTVKPPVGKVAFGDFDRVAPISNCFGYDRGTPIDRYFIELFLAEKARHIRGRVLEVGDASYSKRFGGDQITHQDVLHVNPENQDATIIGDLAHAELLPEGAFDCLLLTQTLHLVYDMPAAVRAMHRALKPGGVALVTVPGLSPIDGGEWKDTWYWFLTQYSAARMFNDAFGAENVEVGQYGNAYVATAFIQGVALEDLNLEHCKPVDDTLPILVTVVARKPAAS